MLAIQGLNQFYSGSHILWDIDMQVPEGSCTCLMGRNGMGKTTLLKCIMGLLPTASGRLSYGLGPDAMDISRLPADRRAGLVVDQLIGQQEIVVKPFDGVLGGTAHFSGATILSDGAPALTARARVGRARRPGGRTPPPAAARPSPRLRGADRRGRRCRSSLRRGGGA